MNHLQQSMVYERAFNEAKMLLNVLNKRRRASEEKALERDEEVSQHFRLVFEDLSRLICKYRELSDKEFALHKAEDVVCDEGLGNLANGVISRAVWDYEIALSKGDEVEKEVLTKWKNEVGQLLTGVDLDAVWSRAEAAHEKFKTLASENIKDMIQISDHIRKNHLVYSDNVNPHRCPMCGSGVYVKTRLKHNTWLVCCSGCMLSEVVEVEG